MSGKSQEGSISNQQKILQLKQKLKSVDSIYPKSSTNINNAPQSSISPIEQTSQQQSRQFVRSPNFQNQGLFQLQLRYSEAEQKLSSKVDQQFKLLQSIDFQIRSIQEQVRTTRKQVDKTRECLEQKTIAIEKQTNQQVIEQIEEIKSIKKQLIDSIEKKYKTIKTETMTVLGNHFETGWEEARDQLSNKIQELRMKVDKEQAERDQTVNYMVNNFGEQILKLEQATQKQREEREQTHKKITISLQRMEEEVTGLILQEKKEAANSLSHLENFLQELCFKIENHLLN